MDVINKIDNYLSEDRKDWKSVNVEGTKKWKRFYLKKLKKLGIKSPEDLSDKEKKNFYDQLKKEYKGK